MKDIIINPDMYPAMLFAIEAEVIRLKDNQLDKKLDSFKDRVIASKVKEAEIMDEFTDILYNIKITEEIPAKAFKEIIDDILIEDFRDQFEFDYDDSQDVFDKFKTFKISVQPNAYQVDLELKVDYEVKRSELVNDVVYSIEEMIVFNEGDEMTLDYMQADQIKQAVESQNYKA